MKYFTAALLLTFILPNTLFAQHPRVSKFIDSLTNINLRFVPAASVSYSPETKWAFSVAGAYYFHWSKDTITKQSFVSAEMTYTQRKQTLIDLSLNAFLKQNTYFLRTNLNYSNFFERYWGIGNQTPNENDESFTFERWNFNSRILRKTKPNLYLGLQIRYQNLYNIETNPDKQLAQGQIAGSKGSVTSGLGLDLMYDSRDNRFVPHKGVFVEIGNLWHSKIIGSQFNYNYYFIDMRTYIPLHKTNILAFQVYAEGNFGNVPFNKLALLGNNMSTNAQMRGFISGRYRDQHYVSSQAEVRLKIWKLFGATAFCSLGDVYKNSLNELNISNLKVGYGGGIRILLNQKDRLTFRVDYAINNQQGSELYITLNEAF